MPATIVLLHVICTWRESNPDPTNIPLITSQKAPRYSTAISGSYYIRIFSFWVFQQVIAQILSLILILSLLFSTFTVFLSFQTCKMWEGNFLISIWYFSPIRRKLVLIAILHFCIKQCKTKTKHYPGLALCIATLRQIMAKRKATEYWKNTGIIRDSATYWIGYFAIKRDLANLGKQLKLKKKYKNLKSNDHQML